MSFIHMHNFKRILIIAAHPDDEILGCGGIISKFKKLDIKFKILFIAEGSSCRYENYNSKEAKEAIIRRNNDAINSLIFNGIKDYDFLNLPCGRLDQVPIIEINKLIENQINKFNPDTIFTHSSDDCNNDHKIIYKSTLMASRPTPKNKVRNVLTYEVLSSSEWNFNSNFSPNYFVSLEESDLNQKINSFNLYKTEVNHYPFPRSDEGIRNMAKIRGMQVGIKFAEAFKLVRSIVL